MQSISWESLSEGERLALARAGEANLLAFTALWFNVQQGEALRVNWHHHYYNWAMQQVYDGKAQNAIINVSPGGTKTEFFSIHAPAYSFVKYPKVRILNTSYSKDLVNENSERTRALVKSAEFREVYPYEVGGDKVDNWTLERSGKRAHQLFSRSSGGQIMGVRGGHITPGEYSGHIGADDWDKPDDMFSKVRRDRGHTRFVNTFRSRRGYHGTPTVTVQQRLHTEDLTAFLLAGKAGLKIDLHVVIPALIDQDYIDALPDGIRERCIRDVCGSEQVEGQWSYWPVKEDIHDLLALREAHPYTFASQNMQDPASLAGEIFNPNDFLYYGDPEQADLEPPRIIEYRFVTADTAQKTNTWNDWTVFAEWGVADGKLWLLNLRRERMDAKKLRREFETFINAAHADNSGTRGNLRHVFVEDKSSGTGLIQELSGKSPVAITAVPRATDKLTRALDVQGHHAQCKVVLPYGAPYNYEFVSEVGGFKADDTHLFDDQVDVMVDALHHVYVAPFVSSGGSAGTW